MLSDKIWLNRLTSFGEVINVNRLQTDKLTLDNSRSEKTSRSCELLHVTSAPSAHLKQTTYRGDSGGIGIKPHGDWDLDCFT